MAVAGVLVPGRGGDAGAGAVVAFSNGSCRPCRAGAGAGGGTGSRRQKWKWRSAGHHGGQRELPRTGAVGASALPCPCHHSSASSSRPGASRGLPWGAVAACIPVLPGAAGPVRALTAASPAGGSAVSPVPLNISQPPGSGEP